MTYTSVKQEILFVGDSEWDGNVEFRFHVTNESSPVEDVHKIINVYVHPKYKTDTLRLNSIDEPLGWVLLKIDDCYYEVNCIHHFDRSNGRDSDFDYTWLSLQYFASLIPRMDVTMCIGMEHDFMRLLKSVQENGDSCPLSIEQIELIVSVQQFIAKHPLVDEYWWSHKQIFKTIPQFANDIVLKKLTPVQIHSTFSEYNKNLEYEVDVKFHKMIEDLIKEVL